MLSFVKKSAAALFLCVVMVLGLLVGAASEAFGADARPCVTATEFNTVQDGWTKKRVHRWFETRGLLTRVTDTTMTRRYARCATGRYTVLVGYGNATGRWRVITKLWTRRLP